MPLLARMLPGLRLSTLSTVPALQSCCGVMGRCRVRVGCPENGWRWQRWGALTLNKDTLCEPGLRGLRGFADPRLTRTHVDRRRCQERQTQLDDTRQSSRLRPTQVFLSMQCSLTSPLSGQFHGAAPRPLPPWETAEEAFCAFQERGREWAGCTGAKVLTTAAEVIRTMEQKL